MPDLEDVSYSREETIEAVRGFYRFLADMYLDPSAIAEPPPEGWPEITTCPEGFDKTEEVMALLKHLPYLKGEPQAGPYTLMADWQWLLSTIDDAARLRDISWGPELYEKEVPPHCIGLTEAYANMHTFLLDTELGIIYWTYMYSAPLDNATKERISHDPEAYAPDEEVEWRSEFPAFAVTDLFEALKDHFRQLNYVPITSEKIYDIWTKFPSSRDGMVEMVQSIYREHGWPDLTTYRKADCMAAISRAMQERYPMDAE
ncbi:hypothetical protein BDZ85DRAFT_51507 [Elsinoe ampelina]|uniref:Uncharacterized protein n=1 Tax=Elsinoe ampelina TaxID=302913 RepID=A0A6A6GLV4_9PEZI|nr:hypothetical protein BDZ85DRAFT_51507 [Elsinoe ampelina]